MIDHDLIEERIVVYVLGGMDPIERAAFEAEFEDHRPGCDRCRTLYRDFSIVSERLAIAAPAIQPPADLEDRVVALATGRSPSRGAGDVRTPRVRRWMIAAAAAVLLAGGFAAGAVAFGGEPPEGLRVAALTGSESGSVAVAFVPGGREAAVIAQGLPELPAGRVYQLWIRSDGAMVGAGTFGSSGVTVTSLPVEHFDLVAFTEEPAGGSEQPTGEPIASAAVR